ncbi:hypothetical protein [Kibdelosporangium aridum]|uniref:hypothetical protein n=1 Tax=Kibdelosporangium aridum TaxID=2030 RepID=UPI000A91A5E3|nr:hypothetical protein [Kibdelosporangium aridum]
MIVVTGATGQLGNAVIERLLNRLPATRGRHGPGYTSSALLGARRLACTVVDEGSVGA